MMSRVSAIKVFRPRWGEEVFILACGREVKQQKRQRLISLCDLHTLTRRLKVMPAPTIDFASGDFLRNYPNWPGRSSSTQRQPFHRNSKELRDQLAIGVPGNIPCNAPGRSLTPAHYAYSIHFRVDCRGRKRACAGAVERRHYSARSFSSGVHAPHRDFR